MLAQHTIDARPTNTEPARGGCRPEPFLEAETEDLAGVDRRLATFVDTACLGGIDPHIGSLFAGRCNPPLVDPGALNDPIVGCIRLLSQLTIRENVLASNDPNMAITLENYADLLQRTGRPTEAEELRERAAVIRRAQPEH